MINDIVLCSMLKDERSFISKAIDFENDKQIETKDDLYIFKRDINFAKYIVYIIRARVIFLINIILKYKGISNRLIRVIINIYKEEKIEIAFLIIDKIEINKPFIFYWS